MIAWKRLGTGAYCAWAALVMVGCGASGGAGDLRGSDGAPVSRLPSWNGSEVEASEPEILPQTHLSAGRLHESHGRLARATEQYQLAIGLRPDAVEAYNRLGIVLDQLSRFTEADDAFARAIELAPDQAYLHNNLGFSYMMQHRLEEAEVELARALELHPEFARAHVNLALVLARQERFDEAMTQFQLALPLEDAHFNMGLMYQSKRRLADAARAFKTALALEPEMVAARRHLAKLPPDVVSAAEPFTTVQASPVPDQAQAAHAPAKSQRPSTQPANTASPGTDSPRRAEPAAPECLSLSIETTMDEADGQSSEPLWMSFDSLLSLDDPFHAFGSALSDEAAWTWTYEYAPYPPTAAEPDETIEGLPEPDGSPEP